jgi:2',3'-cyclic-nucleotide 2'-phosphodiesterase (5'-nucleotidase family)
MMNSIFFSLTLIAVIFSADVSARRLNIIHTNDLHSYFQGNRQGRGGYSKLKTKILELRLAAQAQGLEVLHLDGGDFGEGTSFFLVDEGATSLRALSDLGVDIAVIGNHDHMLGGAVLADQIRRSEAKTKFTSANIVQTPSMNLEGLVTPFVDVDKAGISIRVIGLSTAQAHFQYTLLPGFVLPPVQVGVAQSDLARQQGKELVIALTHIGFSTDESLVKASSEIDLVIGGHSHTRLEEVEYVENKNKKLTPIVQAGSHGLYVGNLVIDLTDTGVEVVSYELHRIEGDIAEDPAMANLVEQAVIDRNNYFEGRWNEVIGESTIPMTGYKNGINAKAQSCWGDHMALMTKEATSSDLGVYISAFAGEHIDPGLITYGDMIDNFPHFRSYNDRGWEMSTIRVNGKALKVLLKAFVNLDSTFGMSIAGLSYKQITIPRFIPFFGGKKLVLRIRSNGQRIKNKQSYTMSFPTEIAFALRETLPAATRKLFPSLNDTGVFYWEAAEEYIRANSPIRCLNDTVKTLDIASLVEAED